MAHPSRPLHFLITLNIAALSYNFWSSVNNPNVLQYKLSRLADPAINNTLLGLFAIGGYLVASVAQPVIGILSDRTRSQFGRRAPYLIAGAFGCLAMAAAILSAQSLPFLFGAVLLNQVFSNTIQGPFQALIPDHVPDAQKGLSAGIKSLIELIGVILAGVAVQRLLAADRLDLLLVAVAAALLIPTVITAVRAPDTIIPAQNILSRLPDRPFWPFVRTLLRDPTYRNLRLWLANRFLFWAGLIALRTFIIGFLQDIWGFTNAAALALSGEFIQLLGVGVLLSTIPAGLLSDRIGRIRLIALACFTAFIGVFLMAITRDIGLLRVIAVVVGAGAGVYFSVNWALVTMLVPATEAALFLGIANIATTLGGAFGQVGGPLIDAINAATGTKNGYFVLFALAGASFLLSVLAILRIRERETDN